MRFGRLRRFPDGKDAFSAGVESHADPEHRHGKHPHERRGIVGVDMPRRHETAVIERGAAAFVHEACTHDPQSAAGRRPLEFPQPVVSVAGEFLRLLFIPLIKPQLQAVDALDGEHSLYNTLTGLPPLFAVTAVGALVGDP